METVPNERTPLLKQWSQAEPGAGTRDQASSDAPNGVCVGTSTGKQEVKSTPTKHLLFDLPIRTKLLLLCLCLSSFSEGMLLSMIAPFFPYVADQRGITSFYVGLVFAVFAFVVLISAPVWGITVKITGPKSMYVTGLLVCGFSAILFGSVGFFIQCIKMPILDTQGMMTSSISVGFVIGPVSGGPLFQAIGYTAAISTAGGLMFAIAIISCIIIPANIQAPVLQERPWWSMLRDLRVLLTLASVMVSTGVFGLIDSTLVLSLRKFNLSLLSVSLVFLAPSCGTAVFLILIGNLNGRYPRYSRIFVTVGLFVIVIGLIFFGPAPFLPIPDSVALRISSAFIACSGVSVLPIFFTHLHEASRRLHLPDDLATHGMISGLFVSADNAGMFWGPLVAGALYDKIGFRWDATIFGIFVLLMAILQAILLVHDFLNPPKLKGLVSKEEDVTLTA